MGEDLAPFGSLAKRPFWLRWKNELVGERLTKVPYTATGARKANIADPATWATLDEVRSELRGFDGIGIVLAEITPRLHLGGIDLDACLDDAGTVAPWAQAIIDLVASYTEISPSGTGLKIYFMYDPAELDEGRHWKKIVTRPNPLGDKNFAIECYLRARYFTVTGKQHGEIAVIRRVDQATLLKVQEHMAAFAPPEKPRDDPPRQDPDDHDLALLCLAHIANDDEFIARDAWLEIGMALHDATGGSTAGLLAWASWTAQKHANAQDACATAWKSFTPGRGITIATLIAHARRRGFDPYARKRQSKANGHAPEPPPGSEQDYGFATRTRPVGDSGSTPGEDTQTPFDGFNFDRHFAERFVGKPAPAESILVSDMIPDERAVLVTADGGAGKSILMQVLCTCVASDKPFVGRATEHGIAVYFTCEDRDEDLHRRQERICHSLEVGMADVGRSLSLRSIVDHDVYLFSQGWATPMLKLFEADLAKLQTGRTDGRRLRVAVIDSSSFVYDDNENDRRVVGKFMRTLNRMAGRLRCTIILIAHTSRTSDGTVARMSSGSTGWVFGSRGSLFLLTTDEGATLKVPKANYTKAGLEVELRWDDNGVLMPVEQEIGVLKNIQERKDDEAVLAEVKARWSGEAEPLSKSDRAGERYLPAYMARNGKMNQTRAKKAMVRLLDARKITPDTYDKKRKVTGLRPC